MSECVKVYVNQDNQAVIRCPNCAITRQADVTRFKEVKNQLTIRCPCGTHFQVELDFRKNFRKKTRLTIQYYRAGESVGPVSHGFVVDLSLRGLRIKTIGTSPVVAGDELFAKFSLDDQQQTEIKRKLVVRSVVEKKYISGEFINPEDDFLDKKIGFYLME